jgi:uncharacterized protein
MGEDSYWLRPEELEKLGDRVGSERLGRRMRAQVDGAVRLAGVGRGGFHFENIRALHRLLELILRATGALGPATRNALSIRTLEYKVLVQGLPPAFDGFRILQISDLHLDGHPELPARIRDSVSAIDFDLAVLTGDFRFSEVGGYEHLRSMLEILRPALECRHGAYGILGNHDFVEMVPAIERAGVRLLLNEAALISREADSMWLVGLDDAHFYGAHDFGMAMRDIPQGAVMLLLVHSPEVIREAEALGFSLYLTGHTHGGQIRTPWGWAPLVNARCERAFAGGSWRHRGMAGYTSLGAGSSGVFARLFCPPEVVVHTLRGTGGGDSSTQVSGGKGAS